MKRIIKTEHLKTILRVAIVSGFAVCLSVSAIGTEMKHKAEIEAISAAKQRYDATAGIILATSEMQRDAKVIAAQNAVANTDTTEEQVYISEDKTIMYTAESGNVPVGASGCEADKITREPVRLITCKSAPAYQATHGESISVDASTGVVCSDGMYLIAIGTGYGYDVGDRVTLTTENGTLIDCVVGDFKQDVHTDPTNKFHATDGSVVELVVDDSYTYHKPECFDGDIVNIGDYFEH